MFCAVWLFSFAACSQVPVKLIDLSAELGKNSGNNFTRVFNRAFSSDSPVKIIIPSGSYLVDSLIIKSNNVTVEGKNSEIILSSKSSKFLLLIKAENVRISNVTFRRAVNAASVSDAIRINNSDGIEVSACNIRGFNGKGIDIAFSDNIRVEDNTIDSCRQGIQFWGGDAKSASAPFVKNIQIKNNRVSRIEGGGIWGSCGENIMASDNTIDNCRDVCLDFEKCYNSFMLNNEVSNGSNACISFFYGCRNIQVKNNRVLQALYKGPGIKFFGSSFIHQRLTLVNNTIKVAKASAILLDKNSATEIEILYNSINGTATGIKAIDCNNLTIDHNSIDLQNGNAGINNEGGSYWKVRNNTIRNHISGSAGESIGIRNYYRSAGFPGSNNSVLNNHITGFTGSVLEDNWGRSILDNLYSGNTIESFYIKNKRGKRSALSRSNKLIPGNSANNLPLRKFSGRDFYKVL